MRETYRQHLRDIVTELERMTWIVAGAVRRSTSALLEADIRSAEEVIAGDAEVDVRGETVEEQVFQLIALQGPVAGELRMLVAALRMVADLERMGDLASHIAKIARMRYPDPAIPVELHPMVEEMGGVAERMVNQAGQLLRSRDVAAAENLERIDDRMDALRSGQFRLMLDESWPHGVEAAVDIALLGRYYERIADHAVSMAQQMVFLVTGEWAAPQ